MYQTPARGKIVKVYVGALYLAAPASDPAAILSADAPWTVRMHFLRDVDQNSILGAFRDGFENNSREKLGQLVPLLDRLAPAVPDVKEGQVLMVAYRPGAGVTVGVDAGAQATVEGKDFADALLLNWLGPDPADSGLKEKMLGLPQSSSAGAAPLRRAASRASPSLASRSRFPSWR